MNLEQQQYPIGRFEVPATISDKLLQEAITILEILPENLRNLTHVMDEATLAKTYRDGGWTIRDVVHHLADSHHNSYTRFKWTLTEDNPTIKAYEEHEWSLLPDYKAPVAWSLDQLEAIHNKLVYLLRTLSEEQWNRTFVHPQSGKTMNLRALTLMYSWHSMHHFAHIKNALER